MLSNSRIDRLGELLRDGKEDAAVLQDLESFRSEFEPAYNEVIDVLRRLGLKVTGRFKTTISIAEKLRRSSGRLAQIQDIAG